MHDCGSSSVNNISLIVALTKKGIIGKNTSLPWHIPQDLANFKQLTQGNIVVMGRKTFESIGKPLPNRINIVVSKTLSQQQIPGMIILRTFDLALLEAQKSNKEIFIIGGNSIFSEGLKVADTLHVSWIKKEYVGNVYFPTIDWTNWQETARTQYETFDYCVYKRKKI